MKHNYTIPILLLYCIFSLSFGEGWGGVSAQTLSPRNIRMTRKVAYLDRKLFFETAVPININGQLVGIANSEDLTRERSSPYIYRLDSTGKFISLKEFRIPTSGGTNYNNFLKVIPYKDSLYIIGDRIETLGDCSGVNEFILKTDTAGNVGWKKEWGDVGKCETIKDALLCSDGGLAFTADVNVGHITDSTGTDYYNGQKATITKYNANGTLKFNKAYTIPYRKDSAEGTIVFKAIAESPDKGFMIAGESRPDYRTYNYATTPNTGLFLVKVDADGNKVWDKTILFDKNLQAAKGLYVSGIIAHPAGGYLLVGKTVIGEWDNKGYGYNNGYAYDSNRKKYYNLFHSGALMMKISEAGNVEWIKSFHPQAPIPNEYSKADIGIEFNHIILSSSGGGASFIISGAAKYLINPPVFGSKDPGTGAFNDNQTIIVKTDLDGKLIWDREYGALGTDITSTYDMYPVHEETGGTIIINTVASDTNIYATIATAPTERGILRLSAIGYLQDPTCSLSPKLIVYDDDILVSSLNNIAYKYEPAGTSALTSVTVTPLTPMPSTTLGICSSPFWAAFDYTSYCYPSGGSIVKFTNLGKGSHFHYDFGDTPSSTADSADVQHLYSAGTYTVTLTARDGDSTKMATFSKTIIIAAGRSITIHPGNTTICQGDSVKITASISSGVFIPCEFIARKNRVPQNAGQYARFFTDTTLNTLPLDSTVGFFINTKGDNCVFSDTLLITVLPSINMKVKGDTVLCAGDSSLLIASGSKTYLWNPENSINDSLMAHPGNTTTYTVSSGGQSNACGSGIATIKVIVNPKPLANAGIDQTIYPGAQAHLLASGGINYLWSPAAGLSSTNIANPIAEPMQTISYAVIITDAKGCVSSDSVKINVKYCGVDLFVPNAFSPNGDNENDVFYVKTLNNDCIQTFSLIIFDRWGNKVFESEDINIGWDGSYDSTSLIGGKGKAMNSGVFVYFLNAIIEGGEIITQKGNITLIR